MRCFVFPLCFPFIKLFFRFKTIDFCVSDIAVRICVLSHLSNAERLPPPPQPKVKRGPLQYWISKLNVVAASATTVFAIYKAITRLGGQ